MKRLAAAPRGGIILCAANTGPQVTAPAAKRAVTVTMKDGTNVAGDYTGADANAVYVTVAGNRMTRKLDDVSAVYFGAPPAAVAPLREAAILAIDAGIIYKMGGNQPVARAEFMLLDESLEAILREAGVPEGQFGVLPEYSFAVKYPPEYPGVAERARQAVRAHVVQSVTTDFAGKARFTDLKSGSYYLAGRASTRGGFAIWNLPVEVKAGENSILLDQNNAATAF